MSRIIFCSFLKCKTEGLDTKVYPGIIGKRIYNEISKQAWQKWINKQTILINEKKLNLINDKDRKILENEMIDFLFKK
ncbi:oxidative damage protection protein [Candidatus Pantoea edessiphila]|uniref:Probable Fe(2+)-trafficking protein n=1 Tax=Candidatus Pantoea edessiphila TaxID=2044610 RepID=A0A2P5T1U9_9GAMM|nr:oxidative damage protection protein [Candidatus Pantoea edessiphila]PPI88520.1 oxidative damage protection protein [Candidatus Pantoea edessiphila]